MFETIASMWLPLCVLTVAGVTTLALAYWAALAAEGKDEWLTGADDE